MQWSLCRVFARRCDGYPVNLTGTDDEALGRWTYIVKREARDESQIVTG
jgi:hypothetical protein